MAEKTAVTVTQAQQHDPVARAKGFWEKNSKPIIYVGGAIILAIAIWFG